MANSDLPKIIEENKLAKFFNMETLGNIANAIPVIPATNTVGGILLAVNYSRQEQFLNDVIEERLKISQKDINKENFLKRFYLTSQVVSKAQTQEKYNRFKKLLINSTIIEISDNDYELFNNVIDGLSDIEFLILSCCYEFHPTSTPMESIRDTEKFHKNIEDKICNKLNLPYFKAWEVLDYMQILYSKGLISMYQLENRQMQFEKMSVIGEKLIKFILQENRDA